MDTRRRRRRVDEDLTKGDVQKIVRDRLDTFANSRDYKKSVREIVIEVLDDFFQNMYTRKSLWKANLKH